MDDDGNSDAYLPLGGIIGITVGGTFLFMCVIVFLVCRLQSRKNRRRSDITMEGMMMRKLSRKDNTFNLSYRKSDEDENLRPISNESKYSFQFDSNAMKSRDNTGRISYDTPYEVLQKLESDQSEAHKRQLQNGVSGGNVVSGFGRVSMISPGYYNTTEVQEATLPPFPPEDGFVSQGQGQAGRLPAYHVQLRQLEVRQQPDYHQDSFRSSVGVDLGANSDKAQRILR